MTEKRFVASPCINDDYNGSIWCDDDPITIYKAVDLLNSLSKENEQLKREKGKLEIEIECLSDELRQCKAVIDKRWNEYLEKKGDDGND